jgi:hypothetical protein
VVSRNGIDLSEKQLDRRTVANPEDGALLGRRYPLFDEPRRGGRPFTCRVRDLAAGPKVDAGQTYEPVWSTLDNIDISPTDSNLVTSCNSLIDDKLVHLDG